MTKKRRKVSCLGNQGANHIDSDTEYKPNSQDPKESHRKVDSDTRDAEHGGIPPRCRQSRYLVDNKGISQYSSHRARNMNDSLIPPRTVGYGM